MSNLQEFLNRLLSVKQRQHVRLIACLCLVIFRLMKLSMFGFVTKPFYRMSLLEGKMHRCDYTISSSISIMDRV